MSSNGGAGPDTGWAYQVSSDIADEVSTEASDLFNAIQDEETPEELRVRVESIEEKLSSLRMELDEMPLF